MYKRQDEKGQSIHRIDESYSDQSIVVLIRVLAADDELMIERGRVGAPQPPAIPAFKNSSECAEVDSTPLNGDESLTRNQPPQPVSVRSCSIVCLVVAQADWSGVGSRLGFCMDQDE